MSHATPSRSRAPNFTSEDQELLLEVLKPYLHIIECKKTDNIKLFQKSEAWAKATKSYNANTKNVSRSVDNLISCYRNMKNKMKKLHSEAKTNTRDSIDKEEPVSALEANGEDWPVAAKTISKPVDRCAAGILSLKTELELLNKKRNIGTGGRPPPDNEDKPIKKLKPILEPPVNGLHMAYDGDADLMKAFHDTVPEEQLMIPIDFAAPSDKSEKVEEVIAEGELNTNPSTSHLNANVSPIINKQEIFKTNLDPALISSKKFVKATKKSCNRSFQSLAEAKLKLVNLQMELVTMELRHKKKVQELELEDITKEHKFRDELRQKKLKLLDLEIKKMSE